MYDAGKEEKFREKRKKGKKNRNSCEEVPGEMMTVKNEELTV